MELKETRHRLYCTEKYYHKADALVEFDSWEEFKDSWYHVNHCFRFDITKDDTGVYFLHLFFILRKNVGFVPVIIRAITEDNMEEIEEYLNGCWIYLCSQWQEIMAADMFHQKHKREDTVPITVLKKRLEQEIANKLEPKDFWEYSNASDYERDKAKIEARIELLDELISNGIGGSHNE
ncbi:hypothetical protein [Bacillus subtilis]|uniref:hypothetical protein n=1 Tax=Bacillus subtilis TaxID=1423 RepID=UPI0025CA059E|nr:hypothetical protein [Bacillus subtilis]GLI90484.1 hypothetical protein ANABIO4_38360 [Bacillus subtilis]